MDDFYREYILDHYKNPRNFGTLENPDVSYEEDNPLCGDKIRIDLKLSEERVADVKFKGQGCAISQAAASILTELVKEKSVEEIKRFGKDEMLNALGVSLGPVRLQCGLLALKVLKAGIYGSRAWPGEGVGAT